MSAKQSLSNPAFGSATVKGVQVGSDFSTRTQSSESTAGCTPLSPGSKLTLSRRFESTLWSNEHGPNLRAVLLPLDNS